ncbi:hypothetical protein K470DRAFT_297111 [Piedraia hortae CBS 480.64]|uniref:Uncharacterized protein n=1 Tax=Piedraia hortae CBS 480.64 TaxID=1314780 RepID=A0A6A7BQ64_9PEZI|nr:hypothetical protein K470DRAFT_297111 [Piedraia hortae CBS 480.64]
MPSKLLSLIFGAAALLPSAVIATPKLHQFEIEPGKTINVEVVLSTTTVSGSKTKTTTLVVPSSANVEPTPGIKATTMVFTLSAKIEPSPGVETTTKVERPAEIEPTQDVETTEVETPDDIEPAAVVEAPVVVEPTSTSIITEPMPTRTTMVTVRVPGLHTPMPKSQVPHASKPKEQGPYAHKPKAPGPHAPKFMSEQPDALSSLSLAAPTSTSPDPPEIPAPKAPKKEGPIGAYNLEENEDESGYQSNDEWPVGVYEL